MKVEIDGIEYVPINNPKIDGEPFGVLIRKARKQRHETFDIVSKNTGLSKSHLCYMEKGKNEPSLKTLQMLLDYYNLSFDQIAKL